jgi:hypothetical protein
MEAVLRLLKGVDLDLLSREPGVNAATLPYWRDVFPPNGVLRGQPGAISRRIVGGVSSRSWPTIHGTTKCRLTW